MIIEETFFKTNRSGISLVVKHLLPKQEIPVRFWYPAFLNTE